MVVAGFGDVRANTRAAAVGSAKVLNSPTGVMFPGSAIAPPMTSTLFARRNVNGDSEAASARLVNGPMAMMSTVSVGLSSRILRISIWDGLVDGLNKDGGDAAPMSETLAALEVSRESDGGRSNNVFQVCSGLVC